MPTAHKSAAVADVNIYLRHAESLLKTGVLESALFRANFSSIATDTKGVIQIVNAS